MGRKAAHSLSRLPQTIFEWSKAFGDDLGFEPVVDPRPVGYAAGSPEKVAAIVERIERGQRLWNPSDPIFDSAQPEFETIGYRCLGDQEYGAVVGKDQAGSQHRYAVWKQLKPSLSDGKRLLYVTSHAIGCDNFSIEDELVAIRRHAKRHKASFVAVCSLFSARVDSPIELRGHPYPVTPFGLTWIRWIARWVDRTIVCWGESPQMDRHIDVLWLLSRTTLLKHVYCLGVNESGWPKRISKAQGMERFNYSPWIAEKEAEEAEDAIDD